MAEDVRRRTVLATGAAALTVPVAACGGGKGGGSATSTSSTQSGSGDKTAGPGKDLGSTSDIPEGGGKVFKDQKVVVTQPKKGEFKAFSAICTHLGCTVNKVANGTIDCPCHGSKFDVADGSVAHGPAKRPLPAKSIKVENNSIRLT
ncbi:iron-sulfur protein [Streptomyces fodineus]|uniref:Cytochrome bc1 complex Rieske iron-sulfur subunit n=1 Tax=Streptomyces fodineus TaxID=1904616 RepID=A0A1D7YHV6_9ACTN|nr:Rieske (2Fe-2S) protein [Streptomyces fodineus]AOR35175.1 iron-sulfur protein [Streptomyces fodineus]